MMNSCWVGSASAARAAETCAENRAASKATHPKVLVNRTCTEKSSSRLLGRFWALYTSSVNAGHPRASNMHMVSGGCHCGNILVDLELASAPGAYSPRACD